MDQPKSANKFIDFVTGFSLITVLIGSTQDILSAGRDWGYIAPLVLLSLLVLLWIFGQINFFRSTFEKFIPYWQSGALAALLLMAVITGIIAYYSTKTERGIIAEQIPYITTLQDSLGLIEDKINNIEHSTMKIDAKLNIQNLSFQGMLIEASPKSPDDYLKNAYIHYKNNHLELAQKNIEEYIRQVNKVKIDVGELLYQILYRQKKNTTDYFTTLYEKNGYLGALFTIHNHTSPSLDSVNTLTDLSIKNPNYLPFSYLLGLEKYNSLHRNLTIKMMLNSDKIWSSLKSNQAIEDIESHFYGYPLTFESLTVTHWKKEISSWFPYYYNSNSNFMEQFVSISNTGSNLCIFKNFPLENIKDSYFHLKRLGSNNILKTESAGNNDNNCMNIQSFVKDNINNIFSVTYEDYDGKIYGNWIFNLNNIDNINFYDQNSINKIRTYEKSVVTN